MRLTPVFMLFATDAAHFPSAARTFGAPEVPFLGRSSVGKSSLINALLGSKQAHTSSTPGRTRAINFFALHQGTGDNIKPRPTLIFADLPWLRIRQNLPLHLRPSGPASSSPTSPPARDPRPRRLPGGQQHPASVQRPPAHRLLQADPAPVPRRRHQVRPPLPQRPRQVARRTQARAHRSTRSSPSPPNPKPAPKPSGARLLALAE